LNNFDQVQNLKVILRIKKILKNECVSEELGKILIIPIKELFPTIYESGKFKNWSDRKIVDYVSELELPKDSAEKIIMVANRVVKIISFT
jgi:hypothetical protein